MEDYIVVIGLIIVAAIVLRFAKRVIGKIISLAIIAVAIIYALVQLGVIVI
jgi:multisubunit Na+/H+ antiporter MnhC subunit